MRVKALFKFCNAIATITFFLIPLFAWGAPHEHEINGYYRSTRGNISCALLYKRDGNFKGDCTLNRKTKWKFSGIWQIKGNMLAYQYTQSSIAGIPVGKTGQDKILRIEKDFFVLQLETGETVKYIRSH